MTTRVAPEMVTDFPLTAPNARLSLVSGVAFPSSDVAGSTSIYVMRVGHLFTTIYDGAVDQIVAAPEQATVSLTAGAHLAGKNYTLFEASNAGVLFYGTGPAWTGDTDRGTGAGTSEEEVFNARRVNKNSITLTNGGTTLVVPARGANVIGGFRAAVAGQATDTETQRFLSSIWQPAPRKLRRPLSFGVHNYSIALWRAVGASASSKVEYFSVGSGQAINLDAIIRVTQVTTNVVVHNPQVGIGHDTTAANAAFSPATWPDNARGVNAIAILRNELVREGYHELWALQIGDPPQVSQWSGVGVFAHLVGSIVI